MTKYGDMIENHEWTDPDPEADGGERTTVKNHEIEVIYTTDPSEDGGYGREKYTAHVSYEDDGTPYVLYAIKHRWKGNYWRDTHDYDWRDVPGPVRQQVAAMLPVDGPDDLDCGTRMVDEGGESRWEKHHKHRMESMSGDEMWGTSFLGDALEYVETAAEAFDDGSEGEARAEELVESIQNTITEVQDAD